MTTVISSPVIKANPTLRRFALIFAMSCITMAVVSTYWSQKLIQHLETANQSISSTLLWNISHSLAVLATLIGFGLLLFSGWSGYHGVQSLREGCYPPSQAFLICDTLHVTGWRSTVKAIAAILLAIASSLGALVIGLEVRGFLAL